MTAQSASATAMSRPLAHPLTHGQVLTVFAGLMLGMLIAALDQTIVATALPTIVGDLGGVEHLSWVVTAYLLASTASTPLWGKLGDLYGRKRVFQTVIVLFLIASALCGLSQSMWQLIVFRGFQGLGGGGLIVTAQAIIGDVVAPRERGRYQGIFGSVFGVTSVAGPLLGGFFVDNLSWHWVFYVNLPIGLVALLVTGVTLPPASTRVQHAIDYAGAACLGSATTCLILMMTLGGTTYPWESPQIVGLGVATAILIALTGRVERRAAEPVLPLSLFRLRAFSAASAVAFIVGFAMFGTTTFIPIYFQIVKGVSPTESGLHMVPMMLGVLTTSTASGQIITRWGRYKIFPVIGTAITALALVLLSTIDGQTDPMAVSAYLLLLGLGLGFVMQVLIVAVQNAVDFENLGAATSGVTFFRSIGSVVGVATFGAIFANQLQTNLARYVASAGLPAGFDPSALQANPAFLRQLPAEIHAGLVQAYAASLHPVFLVAAPCAVLGFALTWLLPELPLRKTAQATDPGEAFGMPVSRSSLDELARALSVLTSREGRRRMYEQLAARAGVTLSPGATWLLLRASEHAHPTLPEVSRRTGSELAVLRPYLEELERQGLAASGDSSEAPIELTPAGERTMERLLVARRDGLAELLSGWSPEQHAELAGMLTLLARSFSSEDRAAPVVA